MRSQLDVCVLDFGDQPVDREHEVIPVAIGTVRQQCAGTGLERVVATCSRPALYLRIAHVRQSSDVARAPGMPKLGKQILQSE
jgi:hypothetical protein